jgi:hypothetical protein
MVYVPGRVPGGEFARMLTHRNRRQVDRMKRPSSTKNDPPIAFDRIRWKGHGNYRVLSHYFSVRWNVGGIDDILDRILGPFAVPEDPEEYPNPATDGTPPQYSIIRRQSEGVSYRLLHGDTEMYQSQELPSVLGQLLIYINQMTIRRSADYLLIHAGAVRTPLGDGVLMPAASGSGKTTMVTGLIRAGFDYLSDEGGAIDPVTRMLYPFRKALWMKPGHKELFPELCPNGGGSDWLSGLWPVTPESIRPGSVAGPCPIRFIIGLTYRPGARTEVRPVTTAEGAVLIAGNAFNLGVYRSRAVWLAADVASGARSYRLVSGDLDGGLGAIMELTGQH